MESKLITDGCQSPAVYRLNLNSMETREHRKYLSKFGQFQSTVFRIEECGVDLNKKVCDLKPDARKDADLCLGFSLSESVYLPSQCAYKISEIDHGYMGDPDDDEMNSNFRYHGEARDFENVENNFCFPGTDIVIVANRQEGQGQRSDGDQKAVILLNTCTCENCQPSPGYVRDESTTYNEAESKWEPDEENSFFDFTTRLTGWERTPTCFLRAALVTLEVEKGPFTKTFKDLEFAPAYAFKSGVEQPNWTLIDKNRRSLVYYAQINLKDVEFLLDDKEKGDDETKEPAAKKEKRSKEIEPCCGCPRITIRGIKQMEWKGPTLKLPTNDSGTVDVPTDFVIVSPDGEEHRCHQAVLSAQIPYFESKFSFDGNLEQSKTELPPEIMTDNGVKFTGKTVQAFLAYIYDRDVKPIEEEFGVAAGLVKLAHYYQANELLFRASAVICRRLEHPGKDTERYFDIGTLWDLYAFAQLMDGVEIMYWMKKAIVWTLKMYVGNREGRFKIQDNPDGVMIENALEFIGNGDKTLMMTWMKEVCGLSEEYGVKTLKLSQFAVSSSN